MNLELYICGKQVDLTDKVSVSLNYLSEDLETPSTEHGGYSKTVTLQGTHNNNRIFGHYFNLDRNLLEKGESQSGISFDPKLRNNFILLQDGNLIEKGYVSLDNVKVSNNKIEYDITLYSEINDFFFNLQYNKDTGEELSLYDLYYGFKVSGRKLTKDEENSINILNWNKDTIFQGWENLRNDDNYKGIDESGIDPTKVIVAAPVYGGLYDDFDSENTMVNLNSLDDSVRKQYFGNIKPTSEWVTVKTTRELDEHEALDLRSQYQHPAIRTKFILDAICNPENNGGYTVEWDEEALSPDTHLGQVFNNSYMLMDRIDFESDEIFSSLNEAYFTKYNVKGRYGNSYGEWNDLGNENYPIITQINDITGFPLIVDTTLMQEPKLSLNFRYDITTNYDCTLSYNYYSTNKPSTGRRHYAKVIVRYFKLRIYDDNTLLDERKYIISDDSNLAYNVYDDFERYNHFNTVEKPEMIAKIVEMYDLQGYTLVDEGYVSDGEGKYHFNHTINLDLPKVRNIRFETEAFVVECRREYNQYYQIVSENIGKGERMFASPEPNVSNYISTISLDNSEEYITNGVYDTTSSNIQPVNVTKRMLFGGTQTPYKYLVGFTKMYGMKFFVDNIEKKVYIKQRKHFYNNKIKDINNRIDRNKDISITPTLCEYKWYLYNLDTPETYAARLYNKKNKLQYGAKKVNTNYYFNNETNELFSDVIYKSVIPYKLNSIYFNRVTYEIPQAVLSPTYELSWDIRNNGENSTESQNRYGYSRLYGSLYNRYDTFPKLCCFGDDNSSESIGQSLIFFNGFNNTEGMRYYLSDNCLAMYQINGGPCYVYVKDGIGVRTSIENNDSGQVNIRCENGIPMFSRYLTNEDGIYINSLDYSKPESTFIDNAQNYSNGVAIYDRYWKKYIENVYDKNAKSVTLYYFLRGNAHEAMKQIYFFDNGFWLLTKVDDYQVNSNKPTKCTFTKIRNVADLLT